MITENSKANFLKACGADQMDQQVIRRIGCLVSPMVRDPRIVHSYTSKNGMIIGALAFIVWHSYIIYSNAKSSLPSPLGEREIEIYKATKAASFSGATRTSLVSTALHAEAIEI